MNKFMRHILLILSIIAIAAYASAEEKKDDAAKKQNLTTKRVGDINVTYEIPADRPIQKKNNILVPMPLDEYIAMKFFALEKRLEKIEAAQQQLKNELAVLEKKLEEQKAAAVASK